MFSACGVRSRGASAPTAFPGFCSNPAFTNPRQYPPVYFCKSVDLVVQLIFRKCQRIGIHDSFLSIHCATRSSIDIGATGLASGTGHGSAGSKSNMGALGTEYDQQPPFVTGFASVGFNSLEFEGIGVSVGWVMASPQSTVSRPL